jgi:hypothetical protein
MHNVIGRTVRDKVTGFSGIVVGRVEYLTGCNQLLVQPKVLDGKMVESAWLDEQRCWTEDTIDALVIDNGINPGCDRAAPRR